MLLINCTGIKEKYTAKQPIRGQYFCGCGIKGLFEAHVNPGNLDLERELVAGLL